jgi:hypothetical protein
MTKYGQEVILFLFGIRIEYNIVSLFQRERERERDRETEREKEPKFTDNIFPKFCRKIPFDYLS